MDLDWIDKDSVGAEANAAGTVTSDAATGSFKSPSSAASTASTASGPASANATYASFTPAQSALPQHSSPLLSSTPPIVTKALSQAYPFILAADYVLGLVTWTGTDLWKSFLIVAAWTALVLYFEPLVKWTGAFLPAAVLAGYVLFNRQVQRQQEDHPTLDAIVHTLSNVVTRLNVLLQPLTQLRLTGSDVQRVLSTTLLWSPLYTLAVYFVVSPRTLLLVSGLFVLTYHSLWAKVTRAILWRSRTVRLVLFSITGLDFSGSQALQRDKMSAAQLKRNSADKSTASDFGSSTSLQSADGQPVRFMYVLYENQRRWLGIGWTSNLLAYERTAWTDEFLNESNPPESFKLPDTSEGTGMAWKWVDKTWKVDLTNDGSLVLPPGARAKTTADPGPNDGFVYYDNTWKKPSSEDTFTKYTRRRRWVRTAELAEAFDDTTEFDTSAGSTHFDSVTSQSSAKSDSIKSEVRKRTRFD